MNYFVHFILENAAWFCLKKTELESTAYALCFGSFWKLLKEQEFKSAFKIMILSSSTRVSWKHIYVTSKFQGRERTWKYRVIERQTSWRSLLQHWNEQLLIKSKNCTLSKMYWFWFPGGLWFCLKSSPAKKRNTQTYSSQDPEADIIVTTLKEMLDISKSPFFFFF